MLLLLLSLELVTSCPAVSDRPLYNSVGTDEGNSPFPNPIAMATTYELDDFWDRLASVCHGMFCLYDLNCAGP